MQKIAFLYEACQAVLSTQDLDEVLRKILDIVREHFAVSNAAVLMFDAESGELRARATTGAPLAAFPPIARGEGLCGAAVRQRSPVYAADVQRDPRYVESIATTRCELAVPLIVRDEVVGVLDLQGGTPDCFSRGAIELMSLFGLQAAIAIQNATLDQRERRRTSQMAAIHAIARQAVVVLDLDVLLDTLCDILLQSFPVDQISVALREPDGRLVIRRRRGRFTACFADGRELAPGSGLCGRALATGAAVLENDIALVPEYVAGYKETASEMVLPMATFGETLGVLVLDSARRGAFDDSDVRALQPVADICATAIQNVQHYQRERQLAYTDGLTGVHNRRFFEERIAQEIERSRRYPGPLSVMMVDIDRFKELNDEFGHVVGDEVLRQVANIFVEQLRKIDIVSRYGGEEFAVIVPETSGEAARQVAEKLRQVIEQWRFAGVGRAVTVSIGVAELPVQGGTRDQLVRAADAALYQAKSEGRNRVATAGSLAHEMC